MIFSMLETFLSVKLDQIRCEANRFVQLGAIPEVNSQLVIKLEFHCIHFLFDGIGLLSGFLQGSLLSDLLCTFTSLNDLLGLQKHIFFLVRENLFIHGFLVRKTLIVACKIPCHEEAVIAVAIQLLKKCGG